MRKQNKKWLYIFLHADRSKTDTKTNTIELYRMYIAHCMRAIFILYVCLWKKEEVARKTVYVSEIL